MTTNSEPDFKQNYQSHLKHLQLKGLRPKTINAYSRAVRRIGDYFDYRIDDLPEPQLVDYFTDLLTTHSRTQTAQTITTLMSRFSLDWRRVK